VKKCFKGKGEDFHCSAGYQNFQFRESGINCITANIYGWTRVDEDMFGCGNIALQPSHIQTCPHLSPSG